jgi:hypothetical protein
MSTGEHDPRAIAPPHRLRAAPGSNWEIGPSNPAVDAAVDCLCADESIAVTLAVIVVQHESHGYGAHWWLWPYDGALACHGYQGQRTIVLPDRDAVVVRVGKTDAARSDQLRARLHEVIRAIPTV